MCCFDLLYDSGMNSLKTCKVGTLVMQYSLPQNIVLVDSIWIGADDAYFVGEIYTLYDHSVWFCAEKGFHSIDIVLVTVLI